MYPFGTIVYLSSDILNDIGICVGVITCLENSRKNKMYLSVR